MRFSFLPFARRIAGKAAAIARRKGGGKMVGRNPLGQMTIRADKDLEELVANELKRAKIPCVLVSEEAGLIELSKEPEWRFVLDPLDGSENYKRGIPIYALGLCYAPINGRMPDVRESHITDLSHGDEFYARKGKGVWRNGVRVKPSKVSSMREAILSLDFHHEIRYRHLSEKAKLGLLECADTRRFGPDLLDICYTACGAIDGFVHGCETLSAVHASGIAMLQEDCMVTDRRGKKIDVPLEVEAPMSVVAAGTRSLHSELLAALRR